MATICGKGLPPRAAFLLASDFLCLVILAPLLFLGPDLANTTTRSFAATTWTLARLMAAGLVCQAFFYYNELYNLQVVRRSKEMLARALRAFALMLFAVAVAWAFVATYPLPLSKMLTFSFFLLCTAIMVRVFVVPRQRERVLILGSGEETADLHELVGEHPEWNVEVTEIMNPLSVDDLIPRTSDPARNFDRIIVCNGKPRRQQLLERLLGWKMHGLPIEDAHAFYERSTGRVLVDGLTMEKCVFVGNNDTGAYLTKGKRIFDVLAASVLLVLASPLIAIVAAVIWCQRDGTILFVQDRMGLHGKPFRIIKFRTMSKKAHGAATKWATDEADRITPLGAFLRKYRLDELLQLLNIIRGDMSLVGPRPEQPEFCRLLNEHIPFYELRHSVLPGLTGWAQVRYHYGSNIEESKRKLEYDLFYVRHASLWLDCAIAIETVKVVLVGRGAK
jgi:exopolysaccharide biosynthesis polyprenyl glycosylphosphotransferase